MEPVNAVLPEPDFDEVIHFDGCPNELEPGIDCEWCKQSEKEIREEFKAMTRECY